METTLQERKEKAIEILNQLDIYEPYIEGFKDKGDVCYYEGFGGFWAWQNEELTKKIKEIENEYNCTVYAVTHEITPIGEFYDFLIVSDYKEEWDYLIEELEFKRFYVYAYVWNVDDDYCSEFGSILVQSFGGGIGRRL